MFVLPRMGLTQNENTAPRENNFSRVGRNKFSSLSKTKIVS